MSDTYREIARGTDRYGTPWQVGTDEGALTVTLCGASVDIDGEQKERFAQAVAETAAPAADRFVTVEEHRWYAIVRVNGGFWRAFAGGREFSGLGVFDDEAEFEEWRRGE